MSDFNKEAEKRYPHSPCLWERDISDDGFSKGWGNHFKAVELYLIDSHTHIDIRKPENVTPYLDASLASYELKRIKHLGLLLPPMMYGEDVSIRYGMKGATCMEDLLPVFEAAKDRNDVSLIVWPYYQYPNLDFLQESYRLGATGVKLHNAPIMTDNGDPEIWLSPEWDAMFRFMEDKQMPVVFHVTQRLNANYYGWGGKNSYWKDGWKRGVAFTNEDLMQIYIKLVEKYPGVPFIGAHQLHVGWPRLCEWFDKYPNFYVDTSVGCVVNEYDRMYESDIVYLRDIFMKYSERILFGTDQMMTDREDTVDNVPSVYHQNMVGNHIRYLRQLDLPFEALENIGHCNFERLHKLEKMMVGVE